MVKNNIFGIPTKKNKKLDLFDQLSNNGEAILQTKKVYEHRELGLNFKYRYVVNIRDLSEYLNKRFKKTWCAEILLIPEISSLNKKSLESILEMVGIPIEELDATDIMSYCGGVRLVASQGTWDDENFKGFIEKDIPEVINIAAQCIEPIDIYMLDDLLDNPYNRIGNTGWDMISKLVDPDEEYGTLADLFEKPEEKEDYGTLTDLFGKPESED